MQDAMKQNRTWWSDTNAMADDVHIQCKAAIAGTNPRWNMRTLKSINLLAISIEGQDKRCEWVDAQRLKDVTTCNDDDLLLPCNCPLHERYADHAVADGLPDGLEVTMAQQEYLTFAIPAKNLDRVMDYCEAQGFVATAVNGLCECSGTTAYMRDYCEFDRAVPLTRFCTDIEGVPRIFTTTTHKHDDNQKWVSLHLSHVPREHLAVVTVIGAPLHAVLAALRSRTK
ncbi:hypothetical protein JKP88DRAFT_284577 [Tribonema minus]|uniref:Uncharacterized protein n=1 Tax=Tribonema minus TaxID=303371 RepID=A0A835ZEB5_9STRA|nr:hypothetical protein JKP88DRAFT_284577 [Tribonema minus]